MATRIIVSLAIIYLFFSKQADGQNAPKREMRGVWIASVSNIDWPSRSGLSTQEQQKELIDLLELSKSYHLNTIVLQVRPATDAFFPSTKEPWSQWITGTQGQAPEPFYDPLEFAIQECRKRGLDIHLWLNPYRAEMDTTKNALSEKHPYKTNPEWFVTYGRTRYFNPGLQETRNHVSAVVADLVRRYDMDAIHMDDYFYPYRIAGVEFPDEAAFRKYPRNFPPDKKEEWRRDNVDLIIKQIHDSIKAIKPYVEFGISPFGVWRNADKDPMGSKTRAGVTNYDDLYADILKWQKEGWIDYITPQLYWHIGMEAADYAILADWWSQHTYGCRLYIGQAWYRIDAESKTPSWQNSDEIIRQIELNRNTPNIDGSMFFSAKSMIKNPLQLKEKLLDNHYKTLALPPVNNRITPIIASTPQRATFSKKRKTITLNWEKSEQAKYYVIYKFGKKDLLNTDIPDHIIHVTGDNSFQFERNQTNNPNRYIYVVSAISITNQETPGVIFKKR